MKSLPNIIVCKDQIFKTQSSFGLCSPLTLCVPSQKLVTLVALRIVSKNDSNNKQIRFCCYAK